MFTYFFKDRSEQTSLFEILGRPAVEELVEEFYRVMETDPRAQHCLGLHQINEGRVIQTSKEKLKFFLIGWLGGPNLFVENYGPPRMRARHLSIKIDQAAKEQWLYCMSRALKKTKLTRKEKMKLFRSFEALAMRIQNH